MVTERDDIALKLINDFGVATTSQLDRLAYNNTRVCQRRLASMTQSGIIFRSPNLYSKEYLYSSSKTVNPKQLKHKLIRTEFYLKLLEIANITNLLVEPQIGNLRPDALIVCKHKKTGKGLFFALEVEISNNRINSLKYETFLDRHYDSVFKQGKEFFTVVYITHKTLPKVDYRTIKLSSDLDDIERIFVAK